MTAYAAPLREMQFVVEELVGLEPIRALPGREEATGDLLRAVLTEAGRFASDVLAPLNQPGDRQGSKLENGVVSTPDGFAEAYRAFVRGGWNGIAADAAWGGQGLPSLVATPVAEIWDGANLAFSLCPLLTQSAIELLARHGSPAQQRVWLPPLVEGRWTGAMNLTEPQAGSDVGALRTRAVRDGDRYRIVGQKIFITWGDHDMAENVVHIVLARVAGAPGGVKGLSLFIVPKFLVGADGSPGPRNDLRCAALEHKLGIAASPTAVMSYGDDGGATGYLVGEENRGIEYMFTMMNSARLGVGLEGVGVGERAYQQARDYALARVQGRDLADPAAGPAAIIRHPDVRRMLMTMKAEVEAARALAYWVAASLDVAASHPDPELRAAHRARVDFLTPVVKAWPTDLGVEIASTALQLHGGAGYIEETGAAQHYRDARIAPIYEGTNGIQALDLARRKLLGDRGAAARALIGEMRAFDRALAGSSDPALAPIRRGLAEGVDAVDRATLWLLDADDPVLAAGGATPYLGLIGYVVGGYLMARAAAIASRKLADGDGERAFYAAKRAAAGFYVGHVLPRAGALERACKADMAETMALSEAQF